MTKMTKLKAAILQKGITQSDLARRSDVNVFTLNRYMTGCARPNPQTLAKLAAALDCKPDELQEVAS